MAELIPHLYDTTRGKRSIFEFLGSAAHSVCVAGRNAGRYPLESATNWVRSHLIDLASWEPLAVVTCPVRSYDMARPSRSQ